MDSLELRYQEAKNRYDGALRVVEYVENADVSEEEYDSAWSAFHSASEDFEAITAECAHAESAYDQHEAEREWC